MHLYHSIPRQPKRATTGSNGHVPAKLTVQPRTLLFYSWLPKTDRRVMPMWMGLLTTTVWYTLTGTGTVPQSTLLLAFPCSPVTLNVSTWTLTQLKWTVTVPPKTKLFSSSTISPRQLQSRWTWQVSAEELYSRHPHSPIKTVQFTGQWILPTAWE